ncbi:YetF domain-containing protein [Chitinophaga sp. MM2321]|uniref:DUF421 domain-containing protein n=1 Tax=Chitinophaga sp. MM2321 TaxID=3137178 RepID=UPI0032D567E3
MNTVDILFGHGEHLTILQMSCRAFIMFFITLALIRLGGMRIFGKKSSFDTIIVIMMGAILARGVIGASPFFATVAASVVMVVIDRILAWLSMKSYKVACIIKGEPILLYENDKIIWENMKLTSLSKEDLLESLRLETNESSLEFIECARMETNGRISFVLKKSRSIEALP